MGNSISSSQKINFEDIQYIIKHPEAYVILNTLNENEQNCLIINSIHAQQEEIIINKLIQKGSKNIHIIIYGRNSNDDTIYKKYQQLLKLGFINVYIYIGGMFEWLMLQDIYGNDEFPTTSKQLDILKYNAKKTLHIGLLEYSM